MRPPALSKQIDVPRVRCQRCGYRWLPRKSPVVLCANPRCRSARWNEPRPTSTGRAR